MRRTTEFERLAYRGRRRGLLQQARRRLLALATPNAVALAFGAAVLVGAIWSHIIERRHDALAGMPRIIRGGSAWNGDDVGPYPGSGHRLVDQVTRVRDGDTIVVGLIPIRIANLDCLEAGTVAGNRATARMKSLASGQTVTCRLQGRRSYDREIATCSIAGRDLGAILIGEGLCRRWP